MTSLKVLLGLCCVFCLTAHAKLPDPTPEQTQAAAEKKAKADAQAEKDKQLLSAKMDEVAQRWRKNAASQGWKAHPATSSSPPGEGAKAPATPPVRSEKAGTAPPSADVKIPENQRPK